MLSDSIQSMIMNRLEKICFDRPFNNKYRTVLPNFKKNILPNAVTIWITVTGIEELRKRLEKRKTDLPNVVEKRLKIAQYEMAREANEKTFDYHVQNNNINDAVNEIIRIIKQNLEIKS